MTFGTVWFFFGHVEHKDDAEWIRRCTTTEVNAITQSKHPRKTWWNDVTVREDMKKFGLSSPGKWQLYVCVHNENTCKNYVDIIPVQVGLMLQTSTSMLRQTKNAVLYVNWLTPTDHFNHNIRNGCIH